MSWEVQNETGKIEVGKLKVKLESLSSSWKARAEVGKFKLNLERLNEVGKINRSWKGKLL